MQSVQAIIMTCDKYRTFTDHMISKYDQLWPDHPFQFRVPYQERRPSIRSHRVTYKQTPVDIKGTVLSLLEDMDDETLIYWCIDDKYPVKIDYKTVSGMLNWLQTDDGRRVDSVLFCRCRFMWCKSALTGNSIKDPNKNRYLERSGYEQIWIHQFLRVKVIRHLFQSFPDKIPYAKMMDRLKREVAKPDDHRCYVSSKNHAVFGESTDGGKITHNCHQSLLENGFDPGSEFHPPVKNFFMGTWSDNLQYRFYDLKRRTKASLKRIVSNNR